MESLWHDVRFGLRSLQANGRFTLVALLTIVLTVGGITTIFTLINSILLRPLPYPHSERLVLIRATEPNGFSSTVSAGDFGEFQKDSRSFESMALYRTGYVSNLDAETAPVRVHTISVTPEIFSILGIKIAAGRALLDDDAKPENPEVAVISFDLWKSRFGGSADAIGKTLQLQRNVSYTIVGVLPAGADVPTNSLAYPAVWSVIREPDMTSRSRTHTAIGRIRPGVALESVNAELGTIAKRQAADNPKTNQGRMAVATFLMDVIVGDTKQTLWVFFGAVSCVLLIGIANLISLQLVRNSARAREICVRAALGAGRWRLVRQLLVETLLLGGVGGVLGLGVAWAGTQAVLSTLPARFPRTDQIGLDGTVFVFALVVSIAVGVLFGAVPAWRASRPNLNAGMNDGSRGATIGARHSQIQRVLIAFETAVALVLLVGAALLANSFGRLISQDAGMQEDRLWAISVTIPLRYRTAVDQLAFWNTAIDRIRALPQAQSATVMVNSPTPLSGTDMLRGGIFPEGKTGSARDGMRISTRTIGVDYFSTLGIPILKGRPILDSDKAGAETVVVVNEQTAAALWPGADPLGKRIAFGKELYTVVGVIPNFKHRRLDGEISPQMYTSYFQEASGSTGATIMLRAKPEAHGVPEAVRSVLMSMEKDVTAEVSTMDQVRWKLLATERFRTVVLLIFAIGATFLAVVGIFGVVSYSVVQRRREIGVRIALGATYRNVTQLMFRQGLLPALIGLSVGVAVSLGLTRFLSSYLFEIQATDPTTFIVATAGLMVAALLASVIPARKASSVDPMIALRHD